MSTKGLWLDWGAIALAMVGVAASAQVPAGSAFTFQGRLDVSGVPANGTYDLRFKLFDDELGGAQIGGNQLAADIVVVDGLFSTVLDFGASAFDGDARWLEIGVREGSSSGAYTLLSPRQRIYAAPLALRALYENWTLTGADLTNSNSGNVGVGETIPLVELHVQGAVNLSNLDASDLGNEQIVIEGGEAWLGLYSDGLGTPGSGISLSEIDSSTGELTKWSLMQRTTTNGDDLSITYGSDRLPNNNARYFVIKSDGDVGIGVENPNSHLHVKAIGTTPFEPPNTLRITSEFPSTTGNTIEFMDLNGNEIHAVQDNVFSTLALQPDGGDVGIGLTNASARLHVRNGAAGFYSSDLAFEDAIIEDDGNAWLGLYSDDVGNVASGITLAEKTPNSAGADTLHKWGIYARTTDNVGDLVITYGTDVNPTVNEKMLQIDRDGTTKVKVLEVLGADVSERFPTTERVEPGAVVMIDADQPGRLCLSRGAYNTRVAGVVSGAGDIPVGAILGNLEGLEDAPPIALSGRVWTRCDATAAGIAPGDLLTTADTPGHAMKAVDAQRRSGAVIGKAMTVLPRGEKGLVLVLVNLH